MPWGNARLFAGCWRNFPRTPGEASCDLSCSGISAIKLVTHGADVLDKK